LQIAARHLDKITIFDISGDIDLATSPQLRKALLREFRELKVPRVVLTLGQFVTWTAPAWRRWWKASKRRATSVRVLSCSA